MKAYNEMVVKRRETTEEMFGDILTKAVHAIYKDNKGRPLDGDEVHAVSRLFVQKLCEFNAEEDQIKAIIRRWPNKKEAVWLKKRKLK